MHQFFRRSLGRHEVIPPARAHPIRQTQDVLRNGIAPAKIVKQPSIELGSPQVSLNPLNVRAHRKSPLHRAGRIPSLIFTLLAPAALGSAARSRREFRYL